MRPRLPADRRRDRTLEVWLRPDELEAARALALRRGLRRRVPGSRPAVYRGDLSKLVQDVLRAAAPDPVTWRRTRDRLIHRHEPAVPEPGGSFRKFQVRVREVWLDRIRKLAEDAGITHGGRGNVSAFIRDLIRIALDD
ncbi:MAG: hypothetical protein R3F20_14705 [Planctomycetota bacterium]